MSGCSCVINGEEVVRELEVVEGKNKEVSEKVREWLDSGGGAITNEEERGRRFDLEAGECEGEQEGFDAGVGEDF